MSWSPGLPKNLTHDGQTLSIRGWAKHLGLGESALRYRINTGWPLVAVLSVDVDAIPSREDSVAPLLVTGMRGEVWQTDDRIGDVALVNEIEPGLWRCLCDCDGFRFVRVGETPLHDPELCRRRVKRTPKNYGADAVTINHRSCMLKRCYTPASLPYPKYGARGVRVCVRWRLSVPTLYLDLSNCPPNLTLDRLDNLRGYGPDNCRWATNAEQARNTSKNRFVEWNGERLCITDWATKLGVKRGTLRSRLEAGWSVERAFTEPLHRPSGITWCGKTQSIAAWTREVGLPKGLLACRLRAGWSVGKALMQKAAFRS